VATVVFIHGLWMPGFDMALLRRRVHRCGYKVQQFHYSTVRKTPYEAAIELHDFLHKIEEKPIHIVAHSLGGLVARHLLHQYPNQVDGKIITLGTPHQGSQIAELFMQTRFGSVLLGKSIEQGLLGHAPSWQANQKLGIIAGEGRMGVGRFFKHSKEPFDGTVAVSETKLEGMSDHITINSSHSGLLFNKTVAKQVCNFLEHGHFQHNK